MNKNLKIILTTICILVLITGLFVLRYARQVSLQNPDDLMGNTAYNLNNGGTFCERNGKVFFSNSNDSNALYVMNSDETEPRKILSTAVVSINADDHRIYYSMSANSHGQGLGYVRKSAGLYSVDHKGNDSICYTTNPVAQALLYGNRLYYQNYIKNSGTTVYSITKDRENAHEIIDQFVNFTNPHLGYIYYGNMDKNHHLYAFDPVTEQTQEYLDLDVYMPVFDSDGFIYYIDPTNDYELHRYDTRSDTDMTISTERLDFFNKYGDLIYYQVSYQNPALHRVNTDGSNDIIIAEGIYKDIQTTSNYVYFRSYDDDTITYHANHYGTLRVDYFNPGVK